MKRTKVSSRYGKALFDLALDRKAIEEVYADIRLILSVTGSSRELITVLKNPVISTDKKVSLFNALFAKKVTPLTLSFITLLVKKNREAALADIAEQYIEHYKLHKNIRTVTLSSAVALDKTVKDKVIAMVKQSMKCEVELVEKTNPALIGGFVLDIDDRQYDASIQNKLRELNREFSVNIYVKGY